MLDLSAGVHIALSASKTMFPLSVETDEKEHEKLTQ